MSEDSEVPPPGGQFLVYQTEDGKLKIDVRFEGETVWLTQQHMAELFLTTKQNIGQHLKGIFAEGELVQDSVVKESFTTAADGKNYATRFYNLDAIISVVYRVKSAVATRFRIWATQRLREYIVPATVTWACISARALSSRSRRSLRTTSTRISTVPAGRVALRG
jgi:hypothetical protein